MNVMLESRDDQIAVRTKHAVLPLSRGWALTLVLGLAFLMAMALGARANAAYEIDNFSANIVKADGTTFESQAGGHPYQGIISFDTKVTPQNNPAVSPVTEQQGATKTIRVDTPPGLVPNPESVPKCTEAQLHDNTCPAASQIGTVELRLRSYLPASATGILSLPAGTKGTLRVQIGLYNMEVSDPSQLARFSFNPTQAPNASGHTVDIEGAMRPDDNGLFFTINNVSTPTQAEPTTPLLSGATLTFWGNPGAVSHDAQRGAASLTLMRTDNPGMWPGSVPVPPYPSNPFPSPPFPAAGTPILANAPINSNVPGLGEGVPLGRKNPTGHAGISAENEQAAFLNNPTSCAGPQQAKLTLDSYQGARVSESFTVGASTNGLQGCDLVPFSATTVFGPSSMQSDAPVPLGVTLNVPQTSDIDNLATAHAKRVSVTLPPGMGISPSAGNGLEACSDAQFAAGTADAISCPAGSRIGAVQITTHVLDSPLQGSVYVGQPLPGNRYRLFLNADGHGISIRLKGNVYPDPVTGQITAVFDDNPQLPFSQFKLDFDGGSKAIIASPQTCGTTTGTSTLTPWSGGAASVSNAGVDVTGCGELRFAPEFAANVGTSNSGAYTPLLTRFVRHDTQQYLQGVSATLPKGMLAKLKGVTQCTQTQVAGEACPESSRIGTVSVKAGPGGAPYALSGSVYLTGGYNGGDFGTVAIIHVVAGPYDLGNVVVRQSLRIDPDTAAVSIVSDPLPQIKEGIVLRLRELTLDVNRAGFMRNPTSCGRRAIEADLASPSGAKADRDAYLSFEACEKLAFAPKISLALANKTQMGKFKYPRLKSVVTQKEGEAGIGNVDVALPKDVALAAKNAKGLCEVAQAAADKCPQASIVGSATAETPILNKSLKGPVYFVKGQRTDAKTGRVIATLPTLYIPLRGETTIKLRAQTAVSKDRLITQFRGIPDAPISKFTLNIDGGKNGIIQATRDLCTSKTLKGSVRFAGHNGKKAATLKPKITTACKAAKKSTTKK